MTHHPTYLPIIALSCTIALSTALTTVNRDLVRDQMSHQSILASFFCIEAAAIYALYMIISRMLSFFLSYIESNSSSSSDTRAGYLASYYYDHIIEDNETVIMDDNTSSRFKKPSTTKSSSSSLHDLFTGSGNTTTNNNSYSRSGFNNGHREALISSMYLGGSGAFLALPALCFWDYSITASFLLSLTLLALFNDYTKQREFKPNQDKREAISTIQRFRWFLYITVIAVILGIAFQDSYYNYYYYYHSTFQKSNEMLNANDTTMLMMTERPWPMMLLSFSSPLLMRMGTINPRTIAHNIIMTPSQSLEVGLPISNLLAILVLCWYSPLENTFHRSSISNMQLFIPMIVLCPSCIAAILAFIIRGFHNKQTIGVVIPLTCTCVVVQQVMDRKLKNHGDWALVGGTAFALLLSLFFILYKRKVCLSECNDSNDPSLLSSVQVNEDDEEMPMISSSCHDLQEQKPNTTTTINNTELTSGDDEDDYDENNHIT